MGVITQEYGLQSHRSTEEILGTFGCSLWKTIRRLWPQFKGNISLQVGNGRKIHFWNEHWIGDESLQSLFLDLFMLTTQNKATSHSYGALRVGILYSGELSMIGKSRGSLICFRSSMPSQAPPLHLISLFGDGKTKVGLQ